jgi:hypothetical protein
MLRVWFGYIPFVPSERGIKMTAPLDVSTKDKQRAIVCLFLMSEQMKKPEIHRQLFASLGGTLCRE